MKIMMSVLLFVGVVIMIALICIGYFLYDNRKQAAHSSRLLSAREREIVSLYDSLEQILDEIEEYTKCCRQEIQEDMEKAKALYNEICAVANQMNFPAPEVDATSSAEDLERERIFLEKERLTKQYKNSSDRVGSKVRRYYNQGVPVSEIAREMNIGQGEVQLRLNLKNKRHYL